MRKEKKRRGEEEEKVDRFMMILEASRDIICHADENLNIEYLPRQLSDIGIRG